MRPVLPLCSPEPCVSGHPPSLYLLLSAVPRQDVLCGWQQLTPALPVFPVCFQTSYKSLVELLVSQKFRWGQSNGT
jgi:hypothetical protein